MASRDSAKAIKQEEELKFPASQILIYSRKKAPRELQPLLTFATLQVLPPGIPQDGEWQQEEEYAAVNRGATKPYAYMVAFCKSQFVVGCVVSLQP